MAPVLSLNRPARRHIADGLDVSAIYERAPFRAWKTLPRFARSCCILPIEAVLPDVCQGIGHGAALESEAQRPKTGRSRPFRPQRGNRELAWICPFSAANSGLDVYELGCDIVSQCMA